MLHNDVLPARAGMARPLTRRHPLGMSSPCTRRDGPVDAEFYERLAGFSLHAQGWPVISRNPLRGILVLPARAGMARRVLLVGAP